MKKEILVIEDDDDIRYLLEYILKGAAYDVTTGTSAKDLYAALDAKIPDIILLDAMLPDGNGIDLCKHIKENLATRHIPIIIMSARQFDNIDSRSVAAYINKPFSINEIVTTVERVAQAN